MERLTRNRAIAKASPSAKQVMAVCHAIAQGYTVLDQVHRNFLHGEMVAMGVLTQLVLEADEEEAARAAAFFVAVGLPVTLGQLNLSPDDGADLDAVVSGAMAFPYIGNLPLEVTPAALRQAILDADALGRRYS